MAADKPLGGTYSNTLNAVAYPHASALVAAFEYDAGIANGVDFPSEWPSEIGGILSEAEFVAAIGGTAEGEVAPWLRSGGRHYIAERPVAAGAQTYELILIKTDTSGSAGNVFAGAYTAAGGFDFLSVNAGNGDTSLVISGLSVSGVGATSLDDIVHVFLQTDGTANHAIYVYGNGSFAGSDSGSGAYDFGQISGAAAEINPEANWRIVSRRYYNRELTATERDQNALNYTTSGEPFAVVGASLGPSGTTLEGWARSSTTSRTRAEGQVDIEVEGWARSVTESRTRAEGQVDIAVEGWARSTTESRTRAEGAVQVGIAVEGWARSTTESRTRAEGAVQVGTQVTGWARSTTESRTRAEGQVDIAVEGWARSVTESRTRAEGQVDLAVEGWARSVTESRTRATGLVEAEGQLTGWARSTTESRTRAEGQVDIAVEGWARSTTESRTRATGETSQAIVLEGWARSTTVSRTRAWIEDQRRREGGGSAPSARPSPVRVVLPEPPPEIQRQLQRERLFADDEDVAAALAFMLLNE